MPRIALLFLIIGVSVYGGTARDFRARTLDGKSLVLSESLKPNRVVLLSFWATWCVPCLEELQAVKKHLEADPSVPLDVITVNVDTSETSTDLRPTLQMYGFTFPVVADPKHEIFGRYTPDKALPLSVLINSTGQVVRIFNGYDETLFEQVKALISAKGQG